MWGVHCAHRIASARMINRNEMDGRRLIGNLMARINCTLIGNAIKKLKCKHCMCRNKFKAYFAKRMICRNLIYIYDMVIDNHILEDLNCHYISQKSYIQLSQSACGAPYTFWFIFQFTKDYTLLWWQKLI